jgi:hypothetical protein
MELLIVMAVIATLMSMDTYSSIKKHANKISASNSIRVIVSVRPNA